MIAWHGFELCCRFFVRSCGFLHAIFQRLRLSYIQVWDERPGSFEEGLCFLCMHRLLSFWEGLSWIKLPGLEYSLRWIYNDDCVSIISLTGLGPVRVLITDQRGGYTETHTHKARATFGDKPRRPQRPFSKSVEDSHQSRFLYSDLSRAKIFLLKNNRLFYFL